MSSLSTADLKPVKVREPRLDEAPSPKGSVVMTPESLDLWNPLQHDCVVTLVHGSKHRVFKSETVLKGSLIGKRLISVRYQDEDGALQWEPFAFLDKDKSRANVWYKKRSSQDQEPSFYEKAARMFERLGSHVLKGYLQVLVSRPCRICHRPLTDPVSVTRGLGPTCANK